MIPLTRHDVLLHQTFVPWPVQHQVEQDLLLCRAMTALFTDPFLSRQIAMRGGTILHKAFLAPAARYSEDIDLVAIGDRRAAVTRLSRSANCSGYAPVPARINGQWLSSSSLSQKWPGRRAFRPGSRLSVFSS